MTKKSTPDAPPQKKKRRRQFTPEFRASAVRLVVEEGRSISEVARDLGLHRSVLDTWVSRAQADAGKGKPGVLTSSEREELTRLRKDVRILKMEREILKKAAAFFAKENA